MKGGDCLDYDFRLMKSEEQGLIFGWASVAVRADGEVVVDSQFDVIEIEELENAVYDFVVEWGRAGEMHCKSDVGVLIESMVFSKEKAETLGIPSHLLPEGWWVGFRICDQSVWEKVKNGTYSMFSIEGTAQRE